MGTCFIFLEYLLCPKYGARYSGDANVNEAGSLTSAVLHRASGQKTGDRGNVEGELRTEQWIKCEV